MGDRPTGVGEPLTASVVEQLRQKARTEQELEASRAADEQRERRIDRLKEEQQAVSLQHAGDPNHWAEARQAAHRAPVTPPRKATRPGSARARRSGRGRARCAPPSPLRRPAPGAPGWRPDLAEERVARRGAPQEVNWGCPRSWVNGASGASAGHGAVERCSLSSQRRSSGWTRSARLGGGAGRLPLRHDAALWSVALFTALRRRCAERASLFTYSTATQVRSALLLARRLRRCGRGRSGRRGRRPAPPPSSPTWSSRSIDAGWRGCSVPPHRGPPTPQTHR